MRSPPTSARSARPAWPARRPGWCRWAPFAGTAPEPGKSSSAMAVAVGEHVTMSSAMSWLSVDSAVAEEAGPITASTAASVSVPTASLAWALLSPSSAGTTATGAPRTPPAALISLTARLAPSANAWPMAAPGPEVGSSRPRVSRPSGVTASGSLVGVDPPAVAAVVVSGAASSPSVAGHQAQHQPRHRGRSRFGSSWPRGRPYWWAMMRRWRPRPPSTLPADGPPSWPTLVVAAESCARRCRPSPMPD